MAATFTIGGQDTDTVIRIRLEADFYDLTTNTVCYVKGTQFNVTSQEDGYIFAKNLDGTETVAIDFGQFTILWSRNIWDEDGEDD